MLQRLSISNFALLEAVHLELHPGMTALTGETGSGKSILLGALGLALGDRADATVIRAGAARCTVEAEFEVQPHADWLEQRGYESTGGLILRREIAAAGRSRAFINDTPCSVAELKELGLRCVDLHGQDETRALAERTTRLRLLDRCADQAPIVHAYRTAFVHWKACEAALERAAAEASAPLADVDYLTYQLQELERLDLAHNDFAALEAEREVLLHATEHRTALYAAAAALEGDDRSSGGIDALAAAGKLLQSATTTPDTEELAARLSSVRVEVLDIARSLGGLADVTEENPERLAHLEHWIAEFERLRTKHRCADAGALRTHEEFLAASLLGVEDRAAAWERAQAEERTAYAVMHAAGEALATSRHAAALALVAQTREHLAGLKLGDAALEFVFAPMKSPDALGTEDVEVLFSANAGTAPLPLTAVASGGERSRLMLALKAATGAFALAPTIVLDEIDTGVSGDVAARMAALMRGMSQHRQVLAITHLPQVASRAPHHLLVFKTRDVPPVTQVVSLAGAQRVEALASMLSGSQITAASLANAEALLAEGA